MIIGLLNSALHVSLGPLESSWVSLQLQSILSGFTVLEPHHRTVSLDVHQTSTRLDFLASEATNSGLWHNHTSSVP